LDERNDKTSGFWTAAISCREMGTFKGLRRHFLPTSASKAL
jgi:hypothetical protein